MEKNGFIRTIFWSLIIGSFGWTTFIGVGLLRVDAAEADKREKCDKEIIDKIEAKLEKQNKAQVETLVVLSEIKKDIKHIMKNGND